MYAAYSIDLCSEKHIRRKVRKNAHRDSQHKSQNVLAYETHTKLSNSYAGKEKQREKTLLQTSK